MGFDWQAFATGFLQQTAKNQTEAREDARNYEERQRELAERNAQTISKRRAVADQVVGLTNMLRDNGASPAVIQAAVSAGPQSVVELANKVNSARETLGRKLSSDDIESLVNIPDGFSVIDMDTEDFIRKTYGLGYEGAGTSEETVERTFMDRLTGRKLRDAARARLDSEVMMDGLTAYDINQMAAQQDYESLVPGTFITFNEMKIFDPATDMATFSRTFTSLVGDLEDSDEFKRLKDIVDLAGKEPEVTMYQTQEALDAAVKEAREKLDKLYLNALQPTIDSMVSTYGDSFVDATQGFLRNYLSDAYVDSLSFEPEEDEDEKEEEKSISQQMIDAGFTGGDIDPADAPFSYRVPSPDMPSIDDAPQPEELEAPTLSTTEETDTAPTVAVGEDEAVQTETPEMEAPEGQGAAPEGYITLDQWDAMTRKQRKDAGLPTSLTGVQQIVRGGLVPLPQPEVEQPPVVSVREKAEKKYGLTQDQAQELVDSGQATEMDIQLIADSGDAILDYIKDKSYPLTAMGVSEGLSDWAQENKKQLPFDMNFLIRFTIGTLKASQE